MGTNDYSHGRATNGFLIKDTLGVFFCCCDIKVEEVEGSNRWDNHLKKG